MVIIQVAFSITAMMFVWCCNSLQWWRTGRILPKWVRKKQEVLLLWRERAAPQYMSKLDILLRVIIRQRSNLAPDWMLEAGAAASWWTPIDWWERRDTVAVGQHWFSANAVAESRWNKRAGPAGGAVCQVICSNIRKLSLVFLTRLPFFFFLWPSPSKSNASVQTLAEQLR